MNSFHVVVRLRSGAGAMLCRRRMLPTVRSEIAWPRLASAPTIRSYPQPGSRARNGPRAPPLPLRPEDGRDKPDAAIRQTSAQSVADTRREGCPAWQRARYPSGLCGRVVSRFRPGWIARHPTSGTASAGWLRESDSRPPVIVRSNYSSFEARHKATVIASREYFDRMGSLGGLRYFWV